MYDIKLETKVIVSSATLVLSGEQVEELVEAIPSVRMAVHNMRDGFLDPVLDLLIALAAAIGRAEPERILRMDSDPEPVVVTTGILKTKRAPRDTRAKQIDQTWLSEQYITLGRSTTDIGRELGCSSSTISKYMRQYGITARQYPGGRPKPDPQ